MVGDPPPSAASRVAPSLACFEAWADREPGRVAIREPEAIATTYGQLQALAGRIASGIVTTAAESRPRVGVLSENATLLAASLLGALKANAAFVPLDPASPRARLASLVADTRPALLLADDRNHQLGESLAGASLPFLGFGSLPPTPTVTAMPPPAAADALAWILYTSSTTGRPKGVMQTRANIFLYAAQVTEGLSLGPANRLLVASPLHLHAGATLSLAALLSGATLTPFDLRETGIEQMAATIDAHAITVLFAVPTIFRALVRLVGPRAIVTSHFARVRLLRLSGETVTPADVDHAWRVFPGLETLSVGLGATETGGISHAYFRRGAAPLSRIPVGTPVEGVSVTLVDSRGRPVPDGRPGEIVVTSRSLSPGYWGDGALTVAKFKEVAGGRQYHTGDLGRRLADGTLEHLGRKGSQTKINGQRVELAEVEAALRRLPGVADAAVRVGGGDDRRSLAAFVVPQPGVRLEDTQLRAGLVQQLPRFMIPTSYTHMTALPTTRSGKVKNSLLRSPRDHDRLLGGGHGRSRLEAAICRIWQDVLDLERPVGRNDDFFALGGDSLQAARAVSRIEAALGFRPSVSAIFTAATPARFAALIALAGPREDRENAQVIARRSRG